MVKLLKQHINVTVAYVNLVLQNAVHSIDAFVHLQLHHFVFRKEHLTPNGYVSKHVMSQPVSAWNTGKAFQGFHILNGINVV